jgi:hypothetical protein
MQSGDVGLWGDAMEKAMAGKHQGQQSHSRDKDKNMSMKGNLGQQDAMREKQSDSEMKRMGERSKDMDRDDE